MDISNMRTKLMNSKVETMELSFNLTEIEARCDAIVSGITNIVPKLKTMIDEVFKSFAFEVPATASTIQDVEKWATGSQIKEHILKYVLSKALPI